MNKTLQLKGAFEQRKNTGGGGAPNLPKGKTINSKKLKSKFDQTYPYFFLKPTPKKNMPPIKKDPAPKKLCPIFYTDPKFT